MQPPRLGRAAPPRDKWKRSGSNAHRRLRGRAGCVDRARVLAEEPMCRPCLAKGRKTKSEEVDHINPNLPDPLWDARENKQGICKPCHKAKTALEAAAAKRSRADR